MADKAGPGSAALTSTPYVPFPTPESLKEQFERESAEIMQLMQYRVPIPPASLTGTDLVSSIQPPPGIDDDCATKNLVAAKEDLN